jgi:hypothetical protein
VGYIPLGSCERSNEALRSKEENNEIVTSFTTISFSRMPLLHGVNSYDFKLDNNLYPISCLFTDRSYPYKKTSIFTSMLRSSS